ncbi:sigma-54 interaction domain-containing protein [Photobacterium kishitanii]|uniref:Sigma-54-dependent Fis family transcriptional regulator n=1 Tax=Photobacterium kishitanii TaxID=318456 RepID=A0A0B7JL69_9GAMM|nr:sigma 54-interacting transcriptional regulator [Photobacterium kishitanii]PSU99223.1 sigma-54-dependent Fis family transcriptional regulator [Photobacterium kishitanii]PSV08715.1 sigma-54-dependent Fis family transcriptional regulator [Photobacterium kishitanii]CEO42067.1 Sigma-54 dependent transcriptional regulator [Photobacterium kishitanii]
MQQWLHCISALISYRDRVKLTDFYNNTLKQELALTASYVVYPTADGRALFVAGNKGWTWDVSDFDHPFSHVLQQASLILLDHNRLVYWQQNEPFKQLAELVDSRSSLLIAPLFNSDKQVTAIQVLIGQQNIINGLLTDDNWHEFSDAFVAQWMLLKDMEMQHSHKQQLSDSIVRLKAQQQEKNAWLDMTCKLIGSSVVMEQLREQIAMAAGSNLTVLIQGETGSGKELVAKAVHSLSSRRNKPFVAINCAAIPENLLESELFGYEKGAFTGALTSRKGLIAQADGGSLFLDEMGELPLALQAKLLRVLETYQYRPLGSNKEQSSNFRLIAATHVNLRQSVNDGGFRQDLYYRIYQYPLLVPNLNSRLIDIDELATYFIHQYNDREQRNILGLSLSALSKLKSLNYPGNVRELRSLIEFACVQTQCGGMIEKSAFTTKLPLDIKMVVKEFAAHGDDFSAINDLRTALESYEKAIIRNRLEQYNGDRAKAAESLGLPKRTLAHKCQKLEIQIR